ncbi:GNAT family N-acetyltransferase [Falsirhodobacter deserti]|uniref:GNAT family N-acetyltransferase n=1 Tax=Falsirhodobacter deserti TaxID=1365611 RepID=UPI000FE43A7C|nr:GNAT family N-acetyltransferase [Falsirhodobacter deserti]
MLVRGRYRAREAAGSGDIARAQALRTRAFGLAEPDCDAFDDICTHILIEEGEELVACYRLLRLPPGQIDRSYSAQFYGLAGLNGFDGTMIEMGRFCVAPERRDPDILRIAWGAMARYVSSSDAQLLFGCSSFRGVEPEMYQDSFALLRQGHLAPKRWLPRVKAPRVFRFARRLRDHRPDMQKALRAMPPLLRSYLVMGGWVSDHAVVDRQMNTLHVFTGLEIKAIPAARASMLRAIAT